MRNLSYQATAVKLDEYWVFSRLEIFWDQDTDIDCVVVNLFVRCAVDIETIKACFWCSIIERCHTEVCWRISMSL